MSGAAGAGRPGGGAGGSAGVRRVAYVLGTTSGGTGRHVAMLAQGAAAAGLEVEVFGPDSAGRQFFPGAAAPSALAAAAAGGGAVLRFAPVELSDRPRPVRDLWAVLRLRGLLRACRPDVAHAHGLRAGALTALALTGARPRIPLVVTVHNAPPGGGPGLIYRGLERIVAARADAVSCVSGDLTARMRRLGAHDGGRALAPAPLSEPPAPDAVAAARAELGGRARPLVLAVGRLAAQKGFADLIAAAARWREHDPAPLLAIAGDGPLAAALRGQAERERADVRFLGRRSDVPALLAAADVFVVASAWEGQPLVVQEALRVGVPIVATRVGGIVDLTGEHGALLVEPGEPAALAAAVVSVLADPDLAGGLAAAARVRAAALPTPAQAVDVALAFYRRVTARGSAAH